jgi:arsenite methyltransferase
VSSKNPLELALSNPWTTLDVLLDGPLHPGGAEATVALLDRADVSAGTRLLDVGCGAGDALARARDRGATAVGLDRTPGAGPRQIRGDMASLPIRSGGVDVALAECVLCLAPSLSDALGEVERVLAGGGRLALSDVVVDGRAPDLPAPIAEALCLADRGAEDELVAAVEAAGFTVGEVRDHREDLLAMRDELSATVDYEGLLSALGETGQRVLASIDDLEAAVENGRVGYVSLVATV